MAPVVKGNGPVYEEEALVDFVVVVKQPAQIDVIRDRGSWGAYGRREKPPSYVVAGNKNGLGCGGDVGVDFSSATALNEIDRSKVDLGLRKSSFRSASVEDCEKPGLSTGSLWLL